MPPINNSESSDLPYIGQVVYSGNRPQHAKEDHFNQWLATFSTDFSTVSSSLIKEDLRVMSQKRVVSAAIDRWKQGGGIFNHNCPEIELADKLCRRVKDYFRRQAGQDYNLLNSQLQIPFSDEDEHVIQDQNNLGFQQEARQSSQHFRNIGYQENQTIQHNCFTIPPSNSKLFTRQQSNKASQRHASFRLSGQHPSTRLSGQQGKCLHRSVSRMSQATIRTKKTKPNHTAGLFSGRAKHTATSTISNFPNKRLDVGYKFKQKVSL